MMSDRSHYDVVVSGMGLAGLSAAYAAAYQGKSVLLLSNRSPRFLRHHRLTLNPVIKNFFSTIARLSCDEDKKFLLILETETTVAMKEIERFLKRRLDELKTVQCVYHSELTAVDMEAGYAKYVTKEAREFTTSSETEILFTDIIGADGVCHHTLNLIKMNPQLKGSIEYHPIKGPKHPYHASAHLKIRQATDKKFASPVDLVSGNTGDFNLDDDGDGEDYFFSLAMNQQSYCKAEQRKIKCTFTGEVPEAIYTNKNEKERKAAMLLHIALMVQAQMSDEVEVKLVSKSKEYQESKDKLRLMFFTMPMQQATKAAITVNHHRYFGIGDNYRSSNYQKGGGASVAISQGLAIGLVLSGALTMDKFNQFCQYSVRYDNGKISEDKINDNDDINVLVERGYQLS